MLVSPLQKIWHFRLAQERKPQVDIATADFFFLGGGCQNLCFVAFYCSRVESVHISACILSNSAYRQSSQLPRGEGASGRRKKKQKTFKIILLYNLTICMIKNMPRISKWGDFNFVKTWMVNWLYNSDEPKKKTDWTYSRVEAWLKHSVRGS